MNCRRRGVTRTPGTPDPEVDQVGHLGTLGRQETLDCIQAAAKLLSATLDKRHAPLAHSVSSGTCCTEYRRDQGAPPPASVRDADHITTRRRTNLSGQTGARLGVVPTNSPSAQRTATWARASFPKAAGAGSRRRSDAEWEAQQAERSARAGIARGLAVSGGLPAEGGPRSSSSRERYR